MQLKIIFDTHTKYIFYYYFEISYIPCVNWQYFDMADIIYIQKYYYSTRLLRYVQIKTPPMPKEQPTYHRR